MPKRTYPHTCEGCKRRFSSGSPISVWCSPTCRTRTKRARARNEADERAKADQPEHVLVTTTRQELEAAGKAATVDGLLTLELAAAIASSGTAGKSALVREFQRARFLALGKQEPAAREDDAEQGDDEDGDAVALGAAVLTGVLESAERKRRDAAAAAAG